MANPTHGTKRTSKLFERQNKITQLFNVLCKWINHRSECTFCNLIRDTLFAFIYKLHDTFIEDENEFLQIINCSVKYVYINVKGDVSYTSTF